jgi:hypothetical protein
LIWRGRSGYRQSGLGREWGAFGIEEFLEVKAILGGTTEGAYGRTQEEGVG